MKKLKAAATRKLGPLPVWAWILIAIAAWYFWRSYSGGSASSTGGSSPFAGNADGTMSGVGGQYPQQPPPTRDPRTNPKNTRVNHGRTQHWIRTGPRTGYWR